MSLVPLGCSGDDGDAEKSTPAETYTVATYNAGLALSFVDYASDRVAPVATALGALDFDLLCLQEVWESEHWDAVVAASPLAHSHRLADDPGEPPDPSAGASCSAEESDTLAACVRANCDVPNDQLTSCALDLCSTEVGALAPDCLGCITGVIGNATIDEILGACAPGGTGGGSVYAYGGSFGTGLLSELPLSAADSLVLESTTNRRAVLYARVAGTPVGDAHVFCTHLTAELGSVPYTGTFGGWAEEQASQVDAMLAFIEEKAAPGDAVIVLGDMNNGPEGEGFVGAQAGTHEKFSDAGYINPYAESAAAECSFCTSNPLNEGTGGPQGGVLIDHVLLRDVSASATASQFLREPLEVDAEGVGVVQTAYSDHYGVQVVLAP